MLTIHKSKRAVSVSKWRRDAVEVRWQTLECCQVCVILTSPLTVFRLKMCVFVWERERARDRVEYSCSCKYLHQESKPRATFMSQSKCWAKIRHQIKTIFLNLFSVKYLRNISPISVECRKCHCPWSLMSIYSTMTSKKASKYFCKFSEKDMAKSVSDAGHYFARCIIILKEQCCMSM